MQRSLFLTAAQLAHGSYLVLPRTGIFQCLKGQSVLSDIGCKVILALDPHKRCLHAGAACFASNKSASSSQPADSLHKVLEERNRLTSATDTPKQSPVESDSSEPDPLQDKSISLVQRFKKTFKQYGKVMIPVHLLTSTVWFGSFYYAAMQGVNIVPFLELIGLPDTVVNILKNSQSGNALTAYALYKLGDLAMLEEICKNVEALEQVANGKLCRLFFEVLKEQIATPARYTVTLGGTSITVKYLRKHGYMSTPPPVKEYIQDRMGETKDKITEKMEETKEKITEKMEVTKEKITEKMGETKDKITGKMEETKDKITEKIQETKDKVSFKKIKE